MLWAWGHESHYRRSMANMYLIQTELMNKSWFKIEINFLIGVFDSYSPPHSLLDSVDQRRDVNVDQAGGQEIEHTLL